MKTDTETRILIQQKNENGEFQTVKTNSDIVGMVFDGDEAFCLITGSMERMTLASGTILGYVMGKKDSENKTCVVRVGESDV